MSGKGRRVEGSINERREAREITFTMQNYHYTVLHLCIKTEVGDTFIMPTDNQSTHLKSESTLLNLACSRGKAPRPKIGSR